MGAVGAGVGGIGAGQWIRGYGCRWVEYRLGGVAVVALEAGAKGGGGAGRSDEQIRKVQPRDYPRLALPLRNRFPISAWVD